MQTTLFQVNLKLLESKCPYCSSKLKILESPLVFEDRTITQLTEYFCKHQDESDEGMCSVVYKGKLCTWSKLQANKEGWN
mgnify:CR=1 FL=1